MRYQPVAGDGLAGVNGEHTSTEVPELIKKLLRVAGPYHDVTGFGQKQCSSPGQFDAATDPIEQPHVVARFERLDGGADRGLCQIEVLRRACDVLKLGDGDEDAKLFQCHSVWIT